MTKFQGHYIMYAARNLFVQKMEIWYKIIKSLLTAIAQRWHIGDSPEPYVSQIDLGWSLSNQLSRSLIPKVALP